jgi:hypothetical protein
MPEKCYPCTWTNLLPMYLDYTQAAPNNDMHRSRRAQFRSFLTIPCGGPVMCGVGPLILQLGG